MAAGLGRAFALRLMGALVYCVCARVLPADVLPGTLAASEIESDVHVFVIQHDGTLEEHDDTTLRANTTAGVDDIAEHYIWFNKDAEIINQITAESIDPEGRAHPVGPGAIRDVQEPRSAGAPTFKDGVLRTVIFPGVEPGWRVHVVFMKTRVKPSQAGMFEYYEQPSRVPVDAQRLIFDLPADMPLYADARGYIAQAPVTANQRTRYEFDYSHGPYSPIENGAVGAADYGDRLMISTVPDFAAFAARYRVGANDPRARDPAIVRLARTLTGNAPDARTKARVLYDWMRTNVRYVALLLGETATMPHPITDILRERYGDCKDHVALFGALLAALGIRSEPALIGLGSVYTLPSVPGYGASAINHVINWLPDLQVFADTTAGGTEFGYLPLILMDRPALLVDEGVLVRTPATAPRARTARLQIDVADNGGAQYAYRVEDSGWAAEPERNRFRRATLQAARQIALDRLKQTGLQGTAQLVTDDVAATQGPFAVSMTGTLDHVVWPTGMTALPALSSLSGGIATQVQGWLAEPVRTQPYVCIDGEFDETAQIILPANVRLVGVPDDLSLQDRFYGYASHYVFDPRTRTVQITRHLRARFGKQVCSPQEFEATRDTLVKIERDALAQLVVQAGGR
jgi:transglutaminase-like putative cysteine protease